MSRDLTGEGAGVNRQESECRKFAEQHGLTVSRVFTDNDVSAFSGTPRPAFAEMIETIKRGGVDGIICWHTDRLYRRARDLEDIVKLVEETGVAVRTVRSGDLDLNTPTGRMVARLVASVSNYEVDHMIERQKLSHSSRAGEGMYRGGGIPYGYRRGSETGQLVVDPEQAKIVREAAKRILAGDGVLTIVKRLNERGVPTQNGKQWRTSTVRRILSKPAVAGLATYHGDVVGKAQWPAILDEGEWRAVNAILSDPKRRTQQGNVKKWQGSGVYVCGRCGGPMGTTKTRKTTGSGRAYLCRQCRKLSRSLDDVDKLVDSVVLGYLSLPENRLTIAQRTEDGGGDFVELVQKRGHLEARKNELGTLFASGVIDAGQLKAGTLQLNKESEALERRIAAAREMSSSLDLVLSGDDLHQRWAEMSPDKRGEVIDELATVTILPTRPGPWFDPESVRVELK